MGKRKDTDNLFNQMDVNIKEIGQTTRKMDKVVKLISVAFIKGILMKVKKKDKGNLHGTTNLALLVSGKTMYSMVREHLSGAMAKNMKVNGQITKCMVREN